MSSRLVQFTATWEENIPEEHRFEKGQTIEVEGHDLVVTGGSPPNWTYMRPETVYLSERERRKPESR